MGIQRQLCFLASLLLVIHAGPISEPSDKDKAIAEDYLRKFDNLKDLMDPASVPPEAKIDPLSERLKEMPEISELSVTGKPDKEVMVMVERKGTCYGIYVEN